MKLTKRQYKAQKAILESRLTAIEQALLDADNTDGKILRTSEMDSETEIYEAWDKLHDAKTDTQNELHDLESEWTTRNWTAGDWNPYALMAANVD